MIRYGQEPVYLTTNEDGGSYLSCCKEHADGYTSVPATPTDLTADAVAAFLDQQEENENRHELVGTYWALLEILDECAGRTAASKVLVRLMERGGLAG